MFHRVSHHLFLFLHFIECIVISLIVLSCLETLRIRWHTSLINYNDQYYHFRSPVCKTGDVYLQGKQRTVLLSVGCSPDNNEVLGLDCSLQHFQDWGAQWHKHPSHHLKLKRMLIRHCVLFQLRWPLMNVVVSFHLKPRYKMNGWPFGRRLQVIARNYTSRQRSRCN